MRAAADLSSLFKTDVGTKGLAYGEGAQPVRYGPRAPVPDKVAGLGAGYLGELDAKPYESLLAKVRSLAAQRSAANWRTGSLVQRLADASEGDAKKELAALATAGCMLLKSADAFIDSLRVGETGERSPLFNAARYLAYAARTRDMLVLDIDLRLEGMPIVKDKLFTGRCLRLAGVAFLWYRLHEPNGGLRLADAVRRMTVPVEVDLRGSSVDGDFWSGMEQVRK